MSSAPPKSAGILAAEKRVADAKAKLDKFVREKDHWDEKYKKNKKPLEESFYKQAVRAANEAEKEVRSAQTALELLINSPPDQLAKEQPTEKSAEIVAAEKRLSDAEAILANALTVNE